jgi:hypothetical protein
MKIRRKQVSCSKCLWLILFRMYQVLNPSSYDLLWLVRNRKHHETSAEYYDGDWFKDSKFFLESVRALQRHQQFV